MLNYCWRFVEKDAAADDVVGRRIGGGGGIGTMVGRMGARRPRIQTREHRRALSSITLNRTENRGGWEVELAAREQPRMVDGGGGAAEGATAVRSAAAG